MSRLVDYPVLTPQQLSAHLRSLRKARGLTQAELALRLGVNQSRLGKIERNPASISVEQFLRLVTLLGARLVISTRDHDTLPHGSSDVARR